ncbi:hypothetical protein DFH09DRAFT_1069450 [Mycena vulgaris]|nr:hypothetical protein DFH09DRAFT_1069450 [Mycena vulgaris]
MPPVGFGPDAGEIPLALPARRALMAPSRGPRWQTSLRHATIQHIVKAKIPEWKQGLYRWQLTIIAWILDGEDVFRCWEDSVGKGELGTGVEKCGGGRGARGEGRGMP